jgi:prepilin-type processing-associated H-X9-DG protein
MAYTANAALIPRNKFTLLLSGGQRTNVLIPEDKVKRPGETILLTEFHRNWKLMGISSPNGSGTLVKSHRPVNVFYHLGSSYNEYNAPKNAPGFVYGKGSNNLPRTQDDYGVYPLNQIEQHEGALDYTSGVPQINAVGRNHPGGDNVFGGTANFVFADNHVERMTPHQSLQQRKWGERYYSLNGANEVLNYRTK